MGFKRITIYWHNGRSLGHTVRSALLAEALLNRSDRNIVVGITGASRGLELLPPNMDFLKLLSYLAYDGHQGVRTEPILQIDENKFQSIRQEMISAFVHSFKPDVLIVDYHPYGKKGELIPAIINSISSKKVLGLRGVLNTPTETNSVFFNSQVVNFIEKYFSAIHVYTDPQVFRLEEYYQFPNSIKQLIKYTGYVTRTYQETKEQARSRLGIDVDKRFIVVSFGGGQGTETIWHIVLKALVDIKDRFDHAYLVAGPYLDPKSYYQFQAELGRFPNMKWFKFLDPLPLYMKASDLFIGSGGYNTLAEVVANKVNALIIPRQIIEREQEIHSSRLAEMGLIRKANVGNPTGLEIRELLTKCLAAPCSERNSLHSILVTGAIRNASLIMKLNN